MAATAGLTGKVRRERRQDGLREVKLWLPDLGDPAVRARLQADLEVLRDHPSNEEGNQFTDAALADMDDWRP